MFRKAAISYFAAKTSQETHKKLLNVLRRLEALIEKSYRCYSF